MLECNTCGAELTDANWIPSWKSVNRKQCKGCNDRKNDRTNPTHNPKRMYVDGKYISSKHPLYKPGRYKTFSDAAFDGTYKLESIKEGYVYAITNPAWPEWVKIGMAIDADDRCNGYQTSSPFRDYSLEHVMITNNRRKAEAQAHKAAAKIAKEQRGEWFKISVKEAAEILNTCSVIVEPEVKKEQQPKQEQVQPAIQDLFSHAKIGT